MVSLNYFIFTKKILIDEFCIIVRNIKYYSGVHGIVQDNS